MPRLSQVQKTKEGTDSQICPHSPVNPPVKAY